MRKRFLVLVVLAGGALRGEGLAFGGHAGLLVPGCGLKEGLHGEEWGPAVGLAVIRPLGPLAEWRLEAGYGGLAGRAPGPGTRVNVERLALMACFRYHPLGARPFVAAAVGTCRYRSRLGEGRPAPLAPPAEPGPLGFLEETGVSRPRMETSPSTAWEETGFSPAWGLGVGLGIGRRLEAEVRWEAAAHRGRTLGAWQLRAGFRF